MADHEGRLEHDCERSVPYLSRKRNANVGRAQKRDKPLQSVPERSQSVLERSGAAAAPDASSKPADSQRFRGIPVRFCPDPGVVLEREREREK